MSSTKTPSNTAVFLPGVKQRFEIKSAPYTRPRRNEIVIENSAVAINPIDWMIQDTGNLSFPWLKYPAVLGTDVTGHIFEIGGGVTRFKLGDRVIGHAVGVEKSRNTPAEGGFQKYTVMMANMVSPIPDSLPFENAVVIPLGLSTAACGLFEKDQLALPYPSSRSKPTPNGKTVLIWGGSTSVGANAIQLAVAAGYDVVTTCSPRNFDFVRKLGASQVFDYNSKTAVTDITRVFKSRKLAGALSIGIGAAEACLDIVHRCDGDKFIAMASYPMPPTPPKRLVLLSTMYYYVSGMVSYWVKAKVRGIRYSFVWGGSLKDNALSKAMYEDFLPEALTKGTFVAVPEPYVVGKGLENIGSACALQKKGMSAKKVVVSL